MTQVNAACHNAGRLRYAAPVILRERGQREVFCGLTGIIWLHRKIQDAFFLVVGSRTCAHLIQSAAGVMIFAEPRFATAIIDERDLAGLGDANDGTGPGGDAAARAAPGHPAAVPGRLLPVGGDQARSVARGASACRARSPRDVRVLNYSGSGIETTFTQGEDACLASLVPELPAAAGDAAPRCWWSARWPTWSRTSSAATVRRDGHRAACASCRRAGRRSCRAVGPGTRFLLAQPFLADTARALEERGAQRLAGAVPARRRGHDPVAAGGGATPSASRRERFDAVTAPAARARDARGRALSAAAGGQARCSSSPTRSWKSRWRASCRANWAWS